MKCFLSILYFIFSQSSFAYFHGIKWRAGQYDTDHYVEQKNVFKIDDKNDFKNEKFPIIPVFKERERGKYTYTQLFYDYEIPFKSHNMSLGDSQNDEDIENNFLSPAELSFTAQHHNWALAVDMETWSAVLGYQWGIYYNAGAGHRFGKVGLGVTGGWLHYVTSFYLCSQYTKEPKETNNQKVVQGECEDKTYFARAQYSGLAIGGAINFTIYEYKGKSFAFGFIQFETGTLIALKDIRPLGRGNLSQKIDISTQFISADFLALSYYW